jgi:hypothetical protein
MHGNTLVLAVDTGKQPDDIKMIFLQDFIEAQRRIFSSAPVEYGFFPVQRMQM